MEEKKYVIEYNFVRAIAALTSIYIISFTIYNSLLFAVENNLYNGIYMLLIKLIKMGLAYLLGIMGCLATLLACFSMKRQTKFLRFTSKHSFSEYLCHSLFMFVICKIIYILIPCEKMTNLLFFISVGVKILIVALLSFIICVAIDKIKNRKKGKIYG